MSEGLHSVIIEFNSHMWCLLSCALGACILIYYYLRFHLKLSKFQEAKGSDLNKPVSIIICAHNEEDNLKKNLPYFLKQDHTEYEVVVVNDGSWDDSSFVVRNMQKEFDHLELVVIDKDMKRSAGKKMALTLGIKKAKYDRFILSDADCTPVSTKWVKKMEVGLVKDFVLGYGRYKKTPGLLNRLIRYDTFQAAGLYFSKALDGTAYMGVGRNLGYTRNIYDAAGGFKSHYHIAAGDDDLFVNHNAGPGTASICLEYDAHTESIAKTTLGDWFDQKRRHIGVSSHYSKGSKLWLGLHHLGQLLFYTGLIAGVIVKSGLLLLLLVFLTKTLIQLLTSNGIAARLREKDLLILLPIFEPLLLVFNMIVAISVRKSKPAKWK